jgi:hypothetical protein
LVLWINYKVHGHGFGLAGYYRIFIEEFFKMARPMNALCVTGVEFVGLEIVKQASNICRRN